MYEANFFLLFQIIHAADFKTLKFNACKESPCCGKHRTLTLSEVFRLRLPINRHQAFTSESRNPSALRVHYFHLCLVLLVSSHPSLCPSFPVRDPVYVAVRTCPSICHLPNGIQVVGLGYCYYYYFYELVCAFFILCY